MLKISAEIQNEINGGSYIFDRYIANDYKYFSNKKDEKERLEIYCHKVTVNVLVIFILVHLISIMNNYFSAKQLTKELMKFHKNNAA